MKHTGGCVFADRVIILQTGGLTASCMSRVK